ncbi:MAG TPA: helix-turn-helix transcriptional regulator [Thermoanaerobaculia bacterium]|nr:helix-turn-helix transcriptional regulator [Thermoanaerobaculia bacterium]
MSEKRISMLSGATLLETRVIESIRTRMERAPLSQSEVERRLRWRRGSVNKLLRGRTRFTLGHIEILGHVIGFTVHDVLLEVLGVPYGLKMRPEEEPGMPAFRNLHARILETESQTAADLSLVRAEVKALENASFHDLVGYFRLFQDIMSRYGELVFALNDLVKQAARQTQDAGSPFDTH